MMKYARNIVLLCATVAIFGTAVFSCRKNKQDIYHQELTGSTTLPGNLRSIVDDGNYPSSVQDILDGLVNGQAISSVPYGIDIDKDEVIDMAFEIIDLRLYNDSLPADLDSSAARVLPYTVEILDNSTWGYCDAMSENEAIDNNGNWSNRTSYVLGTFANAGQFQGAGNRFLAFRKPSGNGFAYGWVKLSCSATNEVLDIISFGFNQSKDGPIETGETE